MTGYNGTINLIKDLLELLSSDPLKDCKRLIDSIVVRWNQNNDDKTALPEFHTEAIYSLRVVLEVVRNLLCQVSNTMPVHSFKSVLPVIDCVVNHPQGCNFSVKLYENILEIINCLLDISKLTNSQVDIHELAKFYVSNLKAIAGIHSSEDYTQINGDFRLEILFSMYERNHGNIQETDTPSKLSLLIEDLKIEAKIEESRTLTDLLLYGCDDAIKKTLFHFTQCFMKFSNTRTRKLMNQIWTDISNAVACQKKDINLTRVFLTLCYIFNSIFWEDFPSGVELRRLIFGDVQYWKLIQKGLTEKHVKKSALFLFKNSIQFLVQVDDDLLVTGENDDKSVYILWDSSKRNEMGSIYQQIIVILEYLHEQQMHIVKPMLTMVEDAVDKILTKIINKRHMDFSWILIIFEGILKHESDQVKKWGLESFLKIPHTLYMNKWTIQKALALLVPSLNNTHLYYTQGIKLSQNLTQFLTNSQKITSASFFLKTFLEYLCGLTWSPEPLFFVTHALANLPIRASWGQIELDAITIFIQKALKTHNKTIRYATQNQFLRAIMACVPLSGRLRVEHLLIAFRNLGTLKRHTPLWKQVAHWVHDDFLFEENLLDSEEPERAALMLMLLVDSQNDITKYEVKFDGIVADFSFSARLYSSEAELIRRLKIFATISEEYPSDYTLGTCPFMDRIVNYSPFILRKVIEKLNAISTIQNMNTVSLYLKTFEQMVRLCGHSSELETMLGEIADIFINKEVSSKPPVRLYIFMQILKMLKEKVFCEEGIYLKEFNKEVYMYLLSSVNDRLEKKEGKFYGDMENDSLANWGALNTSFLESKWSILEHFIIQLKMHEKYSQADVFFNLCVEGLQVGGHDVLFPIMSIWRNLLPVCEKSKGVKVVDLIWKSIMERRKSEVYKNLVARFLEMLFQHKLMSIREYSDVHMRYTNIIFDDKSVGIVNIFLRHIQSFQMEQSLLNPVLCHILAKSLVFGPLLRKDERLLIEICSYIKSLGICEASHCDTSNEIRGRAVEMILSLDRTDPEHQKFAWEMVKKLISEEKEMNEKKVRYFGDSQVHRLKHRLMQALLLLEPMISASQASVEYLCHWLYQGLLSENNQPSVKYQQEWLLVILLSHHPFSLNDFWTRFNVVEKAKGICSLILVAYHLSKFLVPKEATLCLNEALMAILPFSMDHQFEIRLHAQVLRLYHAIKQKLFSEHSREHSHVILKKLYQLAADRKLQGIVDRFEIMYSCILKTLVRGYRGNVSKNWEKLEKDFYLNLFHPIDHYTIQTIFVDLPRLANIGSDEWISLDIFAICGLSQDRSTISLSSATNSLENVECATWFTESPIMRNQEAEENQQDAVDNFQKKMIPAKAYCPELSMELDSYRTSGLKEDGLIVVASLVDRAPNLGGLARTCEVFGASEYIMSSLKYAEDKQFASLSVTAEKWLTVKEVKEKNLLEYLLEMKKNGYVVIGAEQALHSESLSTVKFPKKSLLLLGNEKTGIPPNLLALLDICVEIPQKGIIRSLNVHVTGALFIWEYAKQNHFSIC